jgi:Xaa-Pro aminopeptidase
MTQQASTVIVGGGIWGLSGAYLVGPVPQVEGLFAATGCAALGPNWMDWPMLFSGNSVPSEPGMVFFLHCVVTDANRGVAMSLGRTCLVTDAGREVLSARPLELIVV